MMLDPAALPDDVATLKAMVVAVPAKVLKRDQIIAVLKLTISKLHHAKHGSSSERGRKLLDQLELQLAELEESVAQDEAAAELVAQSASTPPAPSESERLKPARGPLPGHLPRERVVHAAPSQCPDCGGGSLRKLGEDITETLEYVPARWKVIQHVREKFSCRKCEAITQAPAPFHPIARGRAGPELLTQILFAKYRAHLPLTRQSEIYAREGIDLNVLTLADWVGARRDADAAGRGNPRPRLRRRAHSCRRHHRAGTGQKQDPHWADMDLCARRPAVQGAVAAGGRVLLLAWAHG